MTTRLLNVLQAMPKGFDGTHMRKIIRRISIARDGSIQFELINRKTIRREMNTNDGN